MRDIEVVQTALASLSNAQVPRGLRSLAAAYTAISGWNEIALDPVNFLALSLVSKRWLLKALPHLLAAESEARFSLTGAQLVHGDVRSDNICFMGQQLLFVDWSWASHGSGRYNVASWLPSLRHECGPEPESVMPDEMLLPALLSGQWAAALAIRPVSTPPNVRKLQMDQLSIALPWAARVLGLELPSSASAPGSPGGSGCCLG